MGATVSKVIAKVLKSHLFILKVSCSIAFYEGRSNDQ